MSHKEEAEAADRLFQAMPDKSVIHVFNHKKACGFVVQWAEKGTGFGEFTIGLSKETGETFVDTEGMGPEWLGTMLMRLVGTEVQDRQKFWDEVEQRGGQITSVVNRATKEGNHGSDA